MKYVVLALLVLYSEVGLATADKGESSPLPTCDEVLAPKPLDTLVARIFKKSLDSNVAYTLRFKTRRFVDSDVKKIQQSLQELRVTLKLKQIQATPADVKVDIEIAGAGRNVIAALMALRDRNKNRGATLWVTGWTEAAGRSGVATSQGPSTPVPTPTEEDLNHLLRIPSQDLHLSIRASNALEIQNMKFIGDLVRYTEAELSQVAGLAKKPLKEIKQALAGFGLTLGMDTHGWPFPDIDAIDRKFASRHSAPAFTVTEWAERSEDKAMAIFESDSRGLTFERPLAIMSLSPNYGFAMLNGNYFIQTDAREIAHGIRSRCRNDFNFASTERDEVMLAAKVAEWQMGIPEKLPLADSLGNRGEDKLEGLLETRTPAVLIQSEATLERQIVLLPLRIEPAGWSGGRL